MLKRMNTTAIAIILCTCIGFAQTTINLREYGQKVANDIGFPEVTRIIDDDNSLDVYVGTWQTLDSNQNTITLFVTKANEDWLEGITIDMLTLNYSIIDHNGQILFDSRNPPPNVGSVFEGQYIEANGNYVGIWAHDETFESICGTFGTFKIAMVRPINGSSYLKFIYYENFFFDMVVEGDCPNGRELPMIPIKEELRFTRI